MKYSAFLTPRDLSIVRMVYDYDGCTIEHIKRRFFRSPGARTPCYRRISYLTRNGYLLRTRLASTTGQGSGKAFLTIGRESLPILAEALELSKAELKRIRLSSPMIIAHHTALCDLRLSLELAAERSSLFSLQDWITDRELHRVPQGINSSQKDSVIVIIPDASFTLTLPDGSRQNFLVEMDMGTVAPKRMHEKLQGYLLKNELTPVLFVVPNRSRQAAIERWAIEEARELRKDSSIFWITTKNAITEESALKMPIWQVVGGPNSLAIESLAGKAVKTPDSIGFSNEHVVFVNSGGLPS